MTNSSNANPAVTQVGIDNDEGMELAVSRLKKLGSHLNEGLFPRYFPGSGTAQ